MPWLVRAQTGEKDGSQADRLAMAYMQEFDMPGLSIAIARGDRILAARAYGLADTDRRIPVTPDSRFRIASLTKALTSAAVFSLVESGAVRLEDRVLASDGLLPEFAGIGPHQDWLGAITVHHLLTHTAGGWPNDRTDPTAGSPRLALRQLIQQTLRTDPLSNPPGAKWAYSNFGYALLGQSSKNAP